MKTLKRILPLFIFTLLILLLWRGLTLHPTIIPSPLINKSAPHFTLPTLHDPKKMTTHADFKGHVTLVNVWATWCYACVAEHAFLMQLAKQTDVMLYGLNYKDDVLAAKKWLDINGNPFTIIAVDSFGKVAIDWGVYGTPETFILDKKGIIRYKQIGPLTAENWEHDLQPLVEQLRNEL